MNNFCRVAREVDIYYFEVRGSYTSYAPTREAFVEARNNIYQLLGRLPLKPPHILTSKTKRHINLATKLSLYALYNLYIPPIYFL